VFALGLILLVLSGVATLGVVLSNSAHVDANAFGISLSNVSVGGLFVAGAIAGLIFGIGLGLMVAGAARKRRRRVETKRTVKGVRSEKQQLEVENQQLRNELSGNAGQGPGPGEPVVEDKHGLFRR
jgi:TRAP-type C4-dicarboxylate transport system permease large subunit